MIINRSLLALSWVLRAPIILSVINTALGLFEWTRHLAQMSVDFFSGALAQVIAGPKPEPSSG